MSQDTEIPPPPRWLSPKAKTVWRELAPILAEMGILNKGDHMALAGYMDTPMHSG